MSRRRDADGGRLFSFSQWNRALSIRSSRSNRSSTATTASSKTTNSTTATAPAGGGKQHHHRFLSLTSLRSSTQPDLSRRLYRLIKTFNNVISAHSSAGRERSSVAAQLSEWGEQTGDEAVSDVSDKIGVLLAETGELEAAYARQLDEGARAALKAIRNTERSVQPTRDGKRRLVEEIGRLKVKEPQSARLVTLEQELVRAEAEGLVAEAQLGNVTRQKLKEAYTAEFLATIERAEKQIILSRHGLRLLQLLDDTPTVPGDVRPAYAHASQARQILNDAEDDLRDWRPGDLLGSDAKSVGSGSSSVVSQGEQRRETKGKEKEVYRGSEEDGVDAKDRLQEVG